MLLKSHFYSELIDQCNQHTTDIETDIISDLLTVQSILVIVLGTWHRDQLISLLSYQNDLLMEINFAGNTDSRVTREADLLDGRIFACRERLKALIGYTNKRDGMLQRETDMDGCNYNFNNSKRAEFELNSLLLNIRDRFRG